MKNIKGYVNMKTDLNLILLRIQFLEEKEKQINKEKVWLWYHIENK